MPPIQHIAATARLAELDAELAALSRRAHTKRDRAKLIRRAAEAWLDPDATEAERRELSALAAQAMGGLYVDQDGTLCLGRSTQAEPRLLSGG